MSNVECTIEIIRYETAEQKMFRVWWESLDRLTQKMWELYWTNLPEEYIYSIS